jgi:hypothetical protein
VSRRSVRDSWLAQVLFARRVSDPCRRVLICLALAQDADGPWMNERGRVRPVKHRAIGNALGIAEKTVANRILEATRAGFLTKDPTSGHRGRGAAYQATFPAADQQPIQGHVSLRQLVAGTVKVPAFGEPLPSESGEPFSAEDDGKVPEDREPQRARVTDVPLLALVPGEYRGGPVPWDREASA